MIGGVIDETAGSAEPAAADIVGANEAADADVAPAAEAAAAPRGRLRLLLAVAAVILLLDVVTKVLAVRLLTPGQPVSIIGDTVT